MLYPSSEIAAADPMTRKNTKVLTQVAKANQCVGRACWWLKGIDRESVDHLGVADKINVVLSLLQQVDDITIDIQITIKSKQKQ